MSNLNDETHSNGVWPNQGFVWPKLLRGGHDHKASRFQ